MSELIQDDIQYLEFYLYDKNPLSGATVPHTLSNINSINFYMYSYDSDTAIIATTCSVENATLGYCKAFVTIPVAGRYEAEVEVFEGNQRLTWNKIYYTVKSDLGD
jgi:hypothetical protein